MRQRSKQISETFFLGALLATAGGFLDAYTYVMRGNVFANAQTGNIVLLAINLADSNMQKAFYYFIPIVAFTLGVAVTEGIRSKFKMHPRLHWRQIILAAEVLVLAVVAFLPLGKADMAANVAISFLCSIQVQSFRKFNGNAYATTMCTGNLRSASELLVRFFQTKDKQDRSKSLQYFGIILFFLLGAGLGYLLSKVFQEKSVLFCCILFICGIAAMCFQREEYSG